MLTELRLVHYWLLKTNGTPDEWFVGKFHTWGQRSDGEQTDFFAIVEATDGECYELDSTQLKFINIDLNTTVVGKGKHTDQCNCTPHCPPTRLTTETIKRIVHMEHSITIVVNDGRKYLYPSGSVIMFENDTVFIEHKKG